MPRNPANAPITVLALALALGCAGGERAPARAAPVDRDGDGIDDRRDRCTDDPEDLDGDQDDDGCPDLDPPATCVFDDGTPCLAE